MAKAALIGHETQIEVPFHDVDIMRIAWHGHYVKYIEIARTELIRSINYDIDAMEADGFGWPIVDMKLRYVRPARYGSKLTILAEILEWECRLVIRYTIRDAETGEKLTKASTTQVPVNIKTGEMAFGSPLGLRDRLLDAGCKLD